MNNKVLARIDKNSGFKLVDKLLAHQKGWQHYAFSVFIFNSNNELLLQKRANHKYHSPNLWTNTCCSHPLSEGLNDIKSSAKIRLAEEMGFTTNLDFLFQFEYNVMCNNNLIENEIDFVFIGRFNETPIINKKEVSDYKWIHLKSLIKDISINENDYTEWLKIILTVHLTYFIEKTNTNTSVLSTSR